MRLPLRTAAALMAALALGCGGQPTSSGPAVPAATGPHGGTLVALPDATGYGEVLVASEPAAKAGLDARVVAYFLGPDLKAPLSPLPSDVVVKLQLPDAEAPREIPLKPDPDPKDPAGAGRFRSASGPYSIDQYLGELTGTLGGQPFAREFAGR